MSSTVLKEYPHLHHDGKFFMYGSANVNGFAVARLFECSREFFEREMYPGILRDYIRRHNIR